MISLIKKIYRMKIQGKTGYFMGYNQALKDVIALIKKL
jgi:hypothetical protein